VTDFIFAIITEELGLIGAIFLIYLFSLFFYYGLKTAINTKNKFGMYLSIGITSLIFVQFFINIGVVIGLLPVTGITLPFISYGGSSLALNLISVGILINISKSVKEY
jgi:cell division protein FtsW